MIFERLGLAPAINARGTYSDLGGSRLSPGVWQAMQESNRAFIEMEDLLRKTGDAIAQLLGAEAARVTPGVAASLALSAAACMTRGDGRAIERLPDVSGLPNEMLIQRGHRYKYDRCLRLSGIGLVEVNGQGNGEVTPEVLAAAIGPRTAAIIFPAHLNNAPGTLGLEEVAAVARKREVPVVVDAAYMVDPPANIASWLARGGDVVCISAKYYGGPNAGGFVFGRRELIDWIARCDFTGFESSDYLTFGRVFKMDRQIVVGVVEALREWMAIDHQARFSQYAEQAFNLSRTLADIPGVTPLPRFFTMEETLEDGPINCLQIMLPMQIDARMVARQLSERPPRVLVHAVDKSIVAVMDTVLPGEEAVIGERIGQELALLTGRVPQTARRAGS